MPAKRKAAAPAGGSSHTEYGAGGNAGGVGGGSGGAPRVHGAPISRSVRASTKNKVRNPSVVCAIIVYVSSTRNLVYYVL